MRHFRRPVFVLLLGLSASVGGCATPLEAETGRGPDATTDAHKADGPHAANSADGHVVSVETDTGAMSVGTDAAAAADGNLPASDSIRSIADLPPSQGADASRQTGDAGRGSGLDAGVPSPPPALRPLMSLLGRQLLNEGFGSDTWKKSFGFFKADYAVIDGQLRLGTVAGANHPPQASFHTPMKDVAVQIRFRFEGSTFFALQFSNEKVPHHVANVSLSPKSISANRVTGWGKTTAFANVDRAAVALEPGRLYTALVETRGNEISVQLDTGCVVFGEVAGIDEDKTSFSLLGGGSFVFFDEIRAWEAVANPQWAERKAELQNSRPPCK